MPFSRSRSPESMIRSTTAWFSRNTPVWRSIASTSVVLPWSTWATMATLRRSVRTAWVVAVGTAVPGLSFMGSQSVAQATPIRAIVRRAARQSPRGTLPVATGRRRHEPAVEQLDDPVRDLEHHRVVGRDDRRHALGPDDVPDEQHDPLPGLRVELAGRLVGEQEPRPVRERPGDRHPLLLAARELVRAVLRPLAEADELEELGHAGVALSGIRPDEAERHLDVLGRGQDRDQAERLEHERDRVAAHARGRVLGQARDLRPVDHDGARRRLVEAAEEVEQRGLAGARPAADREQLAAGDVHVDARAARGPRSRRTRSRGRGPRAVTIASPAAILASGRA